MKVYSCLGITQSRLAEGGIIVLSIALYFLIANLRRIIPHRWSQPEAYRLYLELLSRYAFSFHPVEPDASKERIIKSVDAALQLSKTYQVHVLELGHTMVLFFFSIVVGLLDSTLDDWGLPVTFLDRASGVARSGDYLNMDIDSKGNKNFKQSEHREQMRRTNSFLAMEVLGTLMENRKAKVLLRLVHLNIIRLCPVEIL
ncbi:Mediator of RNA polymerase II transcription subunit 33B [Vitis vinifera]|uniref:Mediator of RNA polymerase II transcription subunit 33B n=1 Tax=Vitis vinifera TaxID=29760 RepID=A0A438D2U1_VITVI|nr:Mediator of RNA polymerase II transcription subunit 33B [Vitis vinifera]